MSEVIVVTSGKGGVGKTTTAANIGTGPVSYTHLDVYKRQLLISMRLTKKFSMSGSCRN